MSFSESGLRVEPGQILAGKYRVERVLGQGGMGVVVAATHTQLEDRVAIKFLLPEAMANPEAVERFMREARAAVRIKSEHVARVIDVGALDTGEPYMVMEYLDGQDLAQLIRARGALPFDEVVEYLLQTCEAIAEAHSLGIVHRDLKPANLFVIRRRDGTPAVKVLDFGISKLTPTDTGSNMSLTKTTAILGSPLYMSPEQMTATRDVDMRTDIWSLGVILYEALTQQAPFTGQTLPNLCAAILQEPTPSALALRPDTPQALDQVIARCLEKKRENRYATVADLAVALGPFAPRRARASIERISRVLEPTGLSESRYAEVPASEQAPIPLINVASNVSATSASWGQTKAGPSRRGGRLVLAVGAALLITGVAGALFKLSRPTDAPTSAAGSPTPSAVAAAAISSAPAAEPPAAPIVSASAVAPGSAPPAVEIAPLPPATNSKLGARATRPTVPVKPAPARPGAAGKPVDLYNDRQ